MEKKVIKIPATKKMFSNAPLSNAGRRKVCGYARVSTDYEEQQTSYEAQLDYYTVYIKGHPEWEFVGMYSDEGITGTSTKRREGFKKMIEDAMAGKIDLIITKSVSRFARNTVDSLSTIRKLKEHGTEVFFEKENIWTFDAKGELLITIMSSLAQEESRSISENTTWGRRKQMADGRMSMNYKQFLGYDRGYDGNPVINPEQAKTVREIYKLFLAGHTSYSIKKEMERKGYATALGGKWHAGTIDGILRNEKYKGDVLMQKTYTVDFLSGKRVKNEGNVPQYYFEHHHEAIISPEQFAAVQLEFKRRKELPYQHMGGDIFGSKIYCGKCGCVCNPRIHHSNDRYRKRIWKCNGAHYGGTECKGVYINEQLMKEHFVKAINILWKDRESYIEDFEELKPSQDNIEKLKEGINVEKEAQARLIDEIERQAYECDKVAQNNEEAIKKYDGLVREYNAKQDEIKSLTEELSESQAKILNINEFIDTFKKMEAPIIKFNSNLWCGLLDTVTLYGKKEGVTFNFRTGVKIDIR